MASLIGKTLGQYEIKEMLGKGGMATVYLGYQPSIDRYVAIKVLPPHPGLDENFKERFQLEAKTIGGLQNPQILPLYDYGTEDDVLYLVMQYVEGGTLEDRIDSAPLDVTEVDRLLREIARGLDYAHRKGIIHRDIKPANILLQDGHPLLADFGMVKMVASNTNLTGTAVVGTPAYISPEQGQGLEVDKRADIYSLAVVIYEMLTGKHLYDGDTPMQIILKHINADIPNIQAERPDLPAELASVFKKALAKDPADRYQSVSAFANAFSRAIHDAETLSDVRDKYPVNPTTSTQSATRSAPHPTQKFDPPESPATDTTGTGQTIVLRDRVNPLVLMAGFGFIALAIVVVAAFLFDSDSTAPVDEPTSIAANTESTAAPTSPAAALATVDVEDRVGELRYSSTDALGDTISLRLDGTPPPDDTRYAAWLVNTDTDDTQLMGEIAVDAVGTGNLVYTDEAGRMLPATYNAVFITAEEDDIEDAPQGEIVYHGQIPIAAADALHEIFVTSDDGFDGGSLYEGLRTEVNFAEQHSGLAARANNIGGVRTHAEHTINILRGEEIDYNGDDRPQNPGRNVGVYFFIDAIRATLNNATNAEDATIDLQVNAESMRVCTENIRTWANEVVELESAMIEADTIEDATDDAEQSTEVMGYIINGVDANENGIIEAFEGECGLAQIPDYGVQIGNMTLTESAPDDAPN